MKKAAILIFITCFFTGATLLRGQSPVSFMDGTYKLVDSSFHSGVAISIADMDEDGMDDIVRMNEGHNLFYEIQRTGTTFQTIHAFDTDSTGSSAWAMVVGDVANKGSRSVAVGYNGVAILVNSDSMLTNFAAVTLPYSNYFLQNMNFADIDNDGWIDIWGCNDDGTSMAWRNDSTGNFPDTTYFFNPSTTPVSDNSGNYGSIWTDINNDGNIDLFIAHCRQGVVDTADPRRRNQLFINDGNGGYHDDWQNTRGLRIAAQSWTGSFGDIDNNGSLDAVITAQDVPSQIFSNDGSGYFTDITNGSGFVVDVTPIEAQMEDFDNDGFVDILVTGTDSRLYHNNQNRTFTLLPYVFDTRRMESFATGDLNHDGKIDVYGGYGTLYSNPSGVYDGLWLNNTNNSNHFVTFDLHGTLSNRDAMGARVTIYGAWGVQIREVRAGESYGTSNSFMCHFGLGQATTIDSVVIRWPSKIVTRLYNRMADQFITVTEARCASPDNVISLSGAPVLCSGQTLTLTAMPSLKYLWSTGDTTQSISISQQGEYNVKVTAPGNACSSISKTVNIITQPDQTPTITALTPIVFCEGDTVALQSSPATAYSWNNGDTTQTIAVTEAGNYVVTTPGVCQNFSSQPFSISPIPSHIFSVTPGTSCQGVVTGLTMGATGTGTVYWYTSPSGDTIVNTGTSYTSTPNITTTWYVASHDTLFGSSGKVGAVDTSIGAWSNFAGYEYEIFDVYQPIVLENVSVYATTAQPRTVQLRDSTGAVLQSVTYSIPTGKSLLPLNFLIEPGDNYQLGWPVGEAPNLLRNSAGGNYPYTLNGLISITGNSLSDLNFWYVYYNWQVEQNPKVCSSIRVPVTATVLPVPAVSWSGLNQQYYDTSSSVLLSGTPPGGVFSGTGVSSDTFNPRIAGAGGPYPLVYIYTDSVGCSAGDTVQVTVLSSTGIGNITGLSAVHIFPNPNNGVFELALQSTGTRSIDIVITNVLGEKVLEEKDVLSNTFTRPVNLQNASRGLYRLSITSGQEQNSYTVVIQ